MLLDMKFETGKSLDASNRSYLPRFTKNIEVYPAFGGMVREMPTDQYVRAVFRSLEGHKVKLAPQPKTGFRLEYIDQPQVSIDLGNRTVSLANKILLMVGDGDTKSTDYNGIDIGPMRYLDSMLLTLSRLEGKNAVAAGSDFSNLLSRDQAGWNFMPTYAAHSLPALQDWYVHEREEIKNGRSAYKNEEELDRKHASTLAQMLEFALRRIVKHQYRIGNGREKMAEEFHNQIVAFIPPIIVPETSKAAASSSK